MNTEYIGIIFTYGLTFVLAILLGKYIAKVYSGEKTFTDFMRPLERLIYKISGINPDREMNWKQHMVALLSINLVWFVYAFVMFLLQGHLPLNPDHNPSMTPDLSYNTAISFIVNCNLQDYSGETGVTYLTQLFVLTFLHFVSAATGIAALAILFRALKDKTTDKLGNFFHYLTITCTRILLPLAIIVATVLVFHGTPASYEGHATVITMQGDTQQVSRGPAAAMIAIKHLGTNGGGWFNANSAHPLENPDYLTNMLELLAQVLLPIALVFALGFYLKRRKLSWVIYAVMTAGMLLFMIPTIYCEIHGNPAIAHMGVQQPFGNMEGKEMRFGSVASAYWSAVTTIISTGSVNSMHDSYMPLSGAMQMLAMMTNAFYGGCGVGILNYFIFLIIAVFISGLMVGRTPEFLGRKIEAREMKIATIIALLHPFIILVNTALASYILVHYPNAGWDMKPSAWLNNPGFHGFSEMLYQNTSAAANNGSAFAGLTGNNNFWNISTGFVLILGRYLPIIGPIAIAGLLAQKKFIPPSSGTLKSDTFTFGVMTFGVIMIIAALAFFPSLVLGPIAEHYTGF